MGWRVSRGIVVWICLWWLLEMYLSNVVTYVATVNFCYIHSMCSNLLRNPTDLGYMASFRYVYSCLGIKIKKPF